MAATAASTGLTLIPEPPPPDGESPRVQAAMRVLGILPQELQKKELPDYDNIEPRYELFENKRRILMGQVGDMASRSPDALQVLSGSDEGQRSGNASFMAKVLETEKRNMDRMEQKARKDVQNIVLDELETKLVLHNAAKKTEAGAQRVKELKKTRDGKLALIKKEAQKRADKNAEVRRRAQQHQEEEAQELINKLAEANTRATNKLAEVAAGHEEMRLKGIERQAQMSERLAKLEKTQLRHRECAYDGIVAKHEAKMDKLAQTLVARQSMSEAIMQRHEDSMERVREHWEKKQRQTEDRYTKILMRHEHARERRDALTTQQVKEYTTRNTKERNAFSNRYERLQKDLEESPNISRRLTQMGDDKDKLFERSLSESQISALRMRGHHTDLVAANRERLRRAHHHAQEQQLSKIDMMRKRVEFMLQSKATADKRRMEMVKNCALEKSHLTDKIFKVKSAPAEKMINLLQDMDPEPEAAARIREILGAMGLERFLGPSAEDAEKA